MIALGISFILIFMLSEQPVEAIKNLLFGPLRRSCRRAVFCGACDSEGDDDGLGDGVVIDD